MYHLLMTSTLLKKAVQASADFKGQQIFDFLDKASKFYSIKKRDVLLYALTKIKHLKTSCTKKIRSTVIFGFAFS